MTVDPIVKQLPAVEYQQSATEDRNTTTNGKSTTYWLKIVMNLQTLSN